MQKPHNTPLLLLTSTGLVRLNADFLVSKFGICGYPPNLPTESDLRLSREYSKAFLNHPQNEKEAEVRTSADSRNDVGASPAQIEECTNNTVQLSIFSTDEQNKIQWPSHTTDTGTVLWKLCPLPPEAQHS